MPHRRSFTETASPLSAAMAVARGPLLAAGAISLFLNLLYLTMPIYMLQIYDRVLTSGSTATLHYLTLIAAAALLVLGLLEALRSAALSRISSWVDRQLSGTVLGGSVELALSGHSPGAQLLRDLAQLRGFLRDGLRPMLDAPWMPVFVVAIWWMHPWLGVVALISAVLLFLLAVANDLITRRPLRAANAGLVTAHQQAEASLRNADVIRAMGMLPNMLHRWTALNDLLLRRQQTAADRSGMILGISRFLRLFVQVGILGLGAYLVLQGELTAGGIVAASVLLGRALAPIEQAIGAWREFASARSSWQRLEGLFETVAPGPPLMRLPAPAGRLDLERVGFVPPGATEPVLKQVNLQLGQGQVMGVIGPSASGKSTLCRLIVGIWPPTTGHVRLDGAEVHAWDPIDLGRHVGYLPQDVELFAGTVKENIARMNAPDADVDAAVVAAAKLADVHELVLRLPDGYDTQIGEGGAKLSGGQRQRIGLARALYCEPRLVVLDEPNANLDHEGEEALSRAIARLKGQGTTVVLVAHRPRLLVEADQVVVLREGAVQMIGSYDEVVERYGTRTEPARLHQVR